MSQVRALFRSFTGGELTPEFWAQFGDGRFQVGLGLCRNFIPLPHGPVMNRAGFAYVAATKDSGSKKSRLIPFTYSTTQTFAVEVGAGYFRFHTQGATLLYTDGAAYDGAHTYAIGDIAKSGGINYYSLQAANVGHTPASSPTYWYPMPTAPNIYEIPNSYVEADLFDIHYVQSADVLTLVHPNYPPSELRRYGATDWQFAAISFTSPLSAPTGVAAAATSGTGTTTYTYVVTTVGTGSQNTLESLPSSSASCNNDLTGTGAKNTVTWTAPVGATLFNVYKKVNGIYGYIGQASGTSFVDNNIIPDFTKSIPQANNPFPGAGDYPGAVSYFEQRRSFAGTTNSPQNLWMTRSGTESDMSYSIPTRDDDSIQFRVAAREANTIRHIVPLQQLILLTSQAEWRVTSINSDALTPSNVSVRPQSYVGANNAQPAVINNTMLYAAARGGHMREMAYNWQANGYITGDLSLRAPHLFDGYDIAEMAYAKAPFPIVWAVSSSGNLIGLTYVPEQQVGGWHWHDTAGTFESICVVAEGQEDALYAIVKRHINGIDVRYVEKMQTRRYFGALANAFFVDAGLTYSGPPATVITGLSHLEGATVSILADGAVIPQQVVTSGTITLTDAASTVTVGLPFLCDVQTLPFAAMIDNAGGKGRLKNVNKAFIGIYSSSSLQVGPSFDKLTAPPMRTTEPYGSPPSMRTSEIPVLISANWNSSGQVCIRQADPLPLEIQSIALDIEVSS